MFLRKYKSHVKSVKVTVNSKTFVWIRPLVCLLLLASLLFLTPGLLLVSLLVLLKGQCHEIFFMNQFPPSPRVFHLDIFEFFRNFAEIFASQGAPPVSTTPVANLPTTPAAKLLPVSTTPVANLPPVSATPVANFFTIFASVVDTGGKFATGVNDTGGK
jgi:hypothetical protein